MPFTLSHAAAALPFRKFRPVLSALVVGTFAPDFEYFFRLSDEDHIGHRFPAVLIFTLPAALVVLWLFEVYVKKPVIELLPPGFQRRLQAASEPLSFTGARRFAAIVAWTALGIATHLLWDSFTHANTWFWDHLPFLRQRVSVPWHEPVMMNKLVQAASSVLGIAILFVWLVAWYLNSAPVNGLQRPELSLRRRVATVFLICAPSLCGGYFLANWRIFQADVFATPTSWLITAVEAVTLLLSTLTLLYGIGRTYEVNLSNKHADPREHA